LIWHGIILWDGERESVKVLEIQKRVLCSIKGLHKRESCRPTFKALEVLTVTALYIFEVLIYTGCPRRNVQYFGRVFLMLNYTDNPKHLYPKLNSYGDNGQR